MAAISSLLHRPRRIESSTNGSADGVVHQRSTGTGARIHARAAPDKASRKDQRPALTWALVFVGATRRQMMAAENALT